MSVIKPLAVKERTIVASDVERHLEELRILGYTVLRNVYEPGELRKIRAKLDSIYACQLDELGGEKTLGKIEDVTKIRCLLEYDHYFAYLAANEAVLELLRAALGEYFILVSQNGNISDDRGGEIVRIDYRLHRDLTYQHFVSTRPLMITALSAIDPFTEENGATFVVPGTHKVEQCPSDGFITAHEKQLITEAGSVVLMDAMLYHRAGINRTSAPRRSVVSIYAVPFIKQQVSLPAALKGALRDDPKVSRLLGYEAMPAESAKHWRERAIEHQEKSGA